MCRITWIWAVLFASVNLVGQSISIDSNYFQQKVNYKINVALDIEQRQLNGDLEMWYFNQSPDVLHYMYVHLWPNAYANENTAFAKESGYINELSNDQKGYIKQLDFTANQQSLILEYDTSKEESNIDIAKLYFPEPLKPGDSILIKTPFKVKIPHSVSRMGHHDGAFQISQWYPKPAVYDQNGWHPMPYLDQGEFYSEFGNYEVNITLPEDYVVGATGDLQTFSEKAWLEEKAHRSALVLEKILDSTGQYDAFIEDGSLYKEHYNQVPSKQTKTIKYTAENVHDFAWFTDRKWIVEKASFRIENTDRNVICMVMYHPSSAKQWDHALKNCEEAIQFYSKYVGVYPYSQVTSCEGGLGFGGGMEYPMVHLISPKLRNKQQVEQTIVHEIGHNWFQGVLASNERRYPYMDEGLNSFYEKRYLDEKYNRRFHYVDSKFLKVLFGTDVVNFDELTYFYQAKRMSDQAMNLHSAEYSALNYGSIVYYKSSTVFNYLMKYLGEDQFDQIMHSYYANWQFKHPGPQALENEFATSGRNLDFFFNDVVKTTNEVDYKLKKVHKETVIVKGKKYKQMTIKNKGQIAAPYYVASIKHDTIVDTTWYEGFVGQREILFRYDKKVDAYEIDGDYFMPDLNRNNNFYSNKGLFKRTDGFVLRPFFNLEQPRKTELVFTPIAGFNNYDGAMLGLAFYNGFLFEKPFEVTFAPIYGTRSNELVGTGRASFNIKTSEHSKVKSITTGIHYTNFNYALNNIGDEVRDLRFVKIMPFMKFNIKKKDPRQNTTEFLEMRLININKEVVDVEGRNRVWGTDQTGVLTGTYMKQDFRKHDPYNVMIEGEAGASYAKGKIDIRRTFSYTKKGKGLEMRFFGGAFLFDYRSITGVSSPHRDIALQMAGGTGDNDYLFNDVYIDRAIQHTDYGNIWSHHRYWRDGGFRISHQFAETDAWLSTINLTAAIPKFGLVAGFLDLGTAANYDTHSGGETILWNMGLVLNLGFLKVNLPLAYSQTIENAATNRVYTDPTQTEMTGWEILSRNITFSLNITEYNPIKLRDRLLNL